MLEQHKAEFKNLESLIGNRPNTKVCGFVEITDKLYEQAKFQLFEIPKLAKNQEDTTNESKETIEKLKKTVKKYGLNVIPAIALRKIPRDSESLVIIDGHHRIVALYEMKIKEFPAILFFNVEAEAETFRELT